jgi:methyl-accepting chemotaxis protein
MSALKDIAVDLAAERAGEGPAPCASVAKSLREWFSGLSIGGRITFFFILNLWFALFAGVFAIGGFLELGDRAERINITHDHALEAEPAGGLSQRRPAQCRTDGDHRRKQALAGCPQ